MLAVVDGGAHAVVTAVVDATTSKERRLDESFILLGWLLKYIILMRATE